MINQYFVFVFSMTTAFLVNDPRPHVRRWGCLVGLLSQPFWIYATYAAHQWGMLALSFFYTAMWLRGIYHQWIKR
jgi:hypothetical protein